MANINYDAVAVIGAIGAGVAIAGTIATACVAGSALKGERRLEAAVGDISNRVERLEYTIGYGPGSRLEAASIGGC